jgi:hypothetical protein
MDNYNNVISDSVINVTERQRRSYNFCPEPYHRILLFVKDGTNEFGNKYITLESGGRKRIISPVDDNSFVVVTTLLRTYGVRLLGYSYHEGGFAFIIPTKYSIVLDRIFSK